jgi:GTPase SAR1 family protein
MSDEHKKPKDDDKNPLRSMGSALGGWARRVGTILSEVAQQGPPEEVARAISQARELYLAGDHAGAVARLREPLTQRPNDAHLKLAMAITRVAQVLTGGAHLSVLLDLAEPQGKRGERSLPETLAEAARLLMREEFDAALDQLRRGRRLVEDAAEPAIHDARFLLNLLTTLLQVRRGRFERGLLEFQRARARLPEGTRGPLRALLVREGAQLLLAEDHIDEAIAWLTGEADLGNPATDVDQGIAVARAYLAVALAAKGDRIGAEAVRPKIPARPEFDEHLVRVHLCLGTGADARPLALRHLQRDPQDPARKRLWALCEVAAWPVGGCDAAPETRATVLDALVDAVSSAAGERQERHLHELAHVALRADLLSEGTVALIRRRLRDGAASAPEELRLVNARRRLQDRDERAGDDFLPGPPPRFRSQPDLGGPFGPDEISPLRDASQRLGVLRGQRALASAEFCLQRQVPGDSQTVNLHEAAQEYLVEVLTESPEHERARALLAQLAQPLQSNRLEDLLAAATALLAAIPSRVLGVPITGVADALSGVIAARERLARPLTIAVMGEFSSGKSTFVNALLGEVVAPMGVLPTTTTINFFRRGPTGGARVHYRDGSIGTVARGEIHTFLRGLDDVAASRVRHMEIERTSARMGEAAVVDTPGLNALDGFHERVAREFVDEADAIIWIFSATRGGAASEAGVLKSMRADGRQVLGVLNKVDTLDPEERDELITYLKEQFGDVLLDIIPVCASEALERRVGVDPSERIDDPFRAVEEALERHFLAHARELKRSLAARRLGDALASTAAALRQAIAGLEDKASTSGPVIADPAHLEARLVALGDKVYGQLLALDDLLTRECLALGVLRAGAGGKIVVTDQDVTYLTAVLRDSILQALQTDLGELSQEPDSDAFSDILAARLVPWAQGYLDSLESSGFIAALIHEHGHGAAKGEAALRERYRSALAPVAASWRKFIRGQVRAIRQSIAQTLHRTASAPSAEALRLRATTLAGVEALLAGLEQVAP